MSLVFRRQKALLNPPTTSDASTSSPHLPAGPRKDYSLKEGQTLGSISIPGGGQKKKEPGALLLGSGRSSSGASGVPLLPPPPSAPKKRG
jgi:adaptin ear-binding coat-associated protein 1/2